MKKKLKYFLILLSLTLFCSLNIQGVKAQSQLGGIKQEFHKWNKVNGKVSPDLSKRRAAEANLFGTSQNTAIKQKISTGQTQSDMNQKAFQEYEKTDKELNDVYKQILVKYKDDKLFISKLQKAELAWIKYRDAELEAIYPEEDKFNYYGSVYPMCVNQIMTELTRQRIKELKLWLKGICEGNVCAGSRRWE